MTTMNICLSNLPKSAMITGRDGKIYINLTISKMKERDAYGNSDTIFVSKTKEQREANAPTVYVGKGKTWIFKSDVEPAMPADLAF